MPNIPIKRSRVDSELTDLQQAISVNELVLDRLALLHAQAFGLECQLFGTLRSEEVDGPSNEKIPRPDISDMGTLPYLKCQAEDIDKWSLALANVIDSLSIKLSAR